MKLSLPKALSVLTLPSNQDSSRLDSLRRAWAHVCSVQRTGRAGIEQRELQAQLIRTMTRPFSRGRKDWKRGLVVDNRRRKRKEQTQEAREWVTWFLTVTLGWEWGWNREGVARKSLTASNVFTIISHHTLAAKGWMLRYTISQNLKARERPCAAFKRSSTWHGACLSSWVSPNVATINPVLVSTPDSTWHWAAQPEKNVLLEIPARNFVITFYQSPWSHTVILKPTPVSKAIPSDGILNVQGRLPKPSFYSNMVYGIRLT